MNTTKVTTGVIKGARRGEQKCQKPVSADFLGETKAFGQTSLCRLDVSPRLDVSSGLVVVMAETQTLEDRLQAALAREANYEEQYQALDQARIPCPSDGPI